MRRACAKQPTSTIVPSTRAVVDDVSVADEVALIVGQQLVGE